MATATALRDSTTENSFSNKLGRNMTHPLANPRNASAAARKQRVKQGEPFDPVELSRRLQIHIMEQKIKAEKRREARAAAAKAAAEAEAEAVYHPKHAAAAFERTTTQDPKGRKVHKLAEPVLRASVLDTKSNQGLTLLQKTQMADRSLMEKEILRGRNQFQWDAELEAAHEEDLGRGLYEPPPRTFEAEFAHLKTGHKRQGSRPLSTGDVFWEDSENMPPHAHPKIIPAHPHGVNDRPDWCEADQVAAQKKKGRTSPLLRKMESSWILLSKKQKVPKTQNRDEAVAGIDNLDSPPEIKHGFKGNFLARFKRQPSDVEVVGRGKRFTVVS